MTADENTNNKRSELEELVNKKATINIQNNHEMMILYITNHKKKLVKSASEG